MRRRPARRAGGRPGKPVGGIAERLAAVPADIPDIHPNIAIVYRRKVERLAEALADPRDRDEAAEAIRGLIERIVLTPGEKRGEMHAALHGDLGTILEWAGSGKGKGATDTRQRGVSVSVVAGARIETSLGAERRETLPETGTTSSVRLTVVPQREPEGGVYRSRNSAVPGIGAFRRGADFNRARSG